MTIWILTFIQKAFNRYLALDPRAQERLSALQGKTIEIHLRGLNAHFFLVITANTLLVVDHTDAVPDVVMTGTPLRLLQMHFSKEKRQSFFADDIDIRGNLELGQQITDLLLGVDIDWEECLAKRLGDVPATWASRAFKRLRAFIQHADTTFSTDLNEYLHDEAKMFPRETALKQFYQEVDELRMHADRLEARLRLFQSNHQEQQRGSS